MITPEEFPYVKNVHVKNCYAYQNFNIKLHTYKPFSHLILTGKNGSGKTTILNAINNHLSILLGIGLGIKGEPEFLLSDLNHDYRGAHIQAESSGWKNMDSINEIIKKRKKISTLINIYEEYSYINTYGKKFSDVNNKHVLLSSFAARRKIDAAVVETPTKEELFIDALTKIDSGNFLNKNFKQYLVNKRIEQAFDIIDNSEGSVKNTEKFFLDLRNIFRKIFDDEHLQLNFVRKNYEIEIALSGDRKVILEILPEGLSALLSILLDLFIRVDLIRKQARDNTYNPCGIVIIDEPEVHLHLELQEQVLPILTNLFPNIQFVVATHSPAVIASIKNATIFDLTTKETRTSEETVGRSYAELIVGHFGMNNDFSSFADEIFKKVDIAISQSKDQPDVLKKKIQVILDQYQEYISPTFMIELESILLSNA